MASYEAILKKPVIVDEETQEISKKCEVCCKHFATPDYLISHYKRRHLEFYTKEIRPKEDEQLKKELEVIAV